jgi:hypothetical protein
MAMSKLGQTAMIGLMIGIMIFMVAMIFIAPLSDVVTEARDASQLDCANTSISDGKKATCLIVDLILPYFIAVVIGAKFVT